MAGQGPDHLEKRALGAPEALKHRVLNESLGDFDHARHVLAVVGEVVVVQAASKDARRLVGDTAFMQNAHLDRTYADGQGVNGG